MITGVLMQKDGAPVRVLRFFVADELLQAAGSMRRKNNGHGVIRLRGDGSRRAPAARASATIDADVKRL